MIAPTSSFIQLAQGGGFDWEALIPVVFILLYALSQIFGVGRKKDGKKKPTSAPASSPAERQQESEQESRARQIREEIQRKIAERREQTEVPAQRDLSEGRPRYDPSRSEQEQRRRSTAPTARRELSGGHRASSSASHRDLSPGGGQSAGGSSVEAQLSEQRERLAAARREREAAQRKARDIVRRGQGVEGPRFAASHEYSWDLPDMSPARYRSDLIRLLSDPAGAQKAVLFREVLGPPLAYRDPTSPHERIP